MKILVTGGLGTVGSGLIRQLRARQHHVISCDRSHQPDEVGFSLRTDVRGPLYARCDVGEFRQLERVFERLGPFDYVYHCAAEFGRWNGEDFYETLWKTNAVGTKNVIRMQERLNFKLIHFSSSEGYGHYAGEHCRQLQCGRDLQHWWQLFSQHRRAFRRSAESDRRPSAPGRISGFGDPHDQA